MGMASPASRPIPDATGHALGLEPALQLGRRPEGLAGRHEDDQGLVAAQLEEEPLAGLHYLPDDAAEAGHKTAAAASPNSAV